MTGRLQLFLAVRDNRSESRLPALRVDHGSQVTPRIPYMCGRTEVRHAAAHGVNVGTFGATDGSKPELRLLGLVGSPTLRKQIDR